jgi:hypothetical protein
MEITFNKIILSLLLGCTLHMTLAQSNTKLCKATEKEHFKKIQRLLKQQVRHHKNGQRYYNGEGSGYQTNFTPALDSITNWFKNQSCVVDAYWDRCESKIAIYPGWSVIGVKFKTKKWNPRKMLLHSAWNNRKNKSFRLETAIIQNQKQIGL